MKKVELLSPSGDFESLKMAVLNGADAVYLAGKKFGARAFSNNFTQEELLEAINYCHLYGVKVYITINTIVYEDEVKEFLEFVKLIYDNNVDAVIIQDIGMADLIHKKFPDLELHASTQMNIMDIESLKLLKNIGFKRVVLARETPLSLIKQMKKEVDIELEVFIHGALCVSCSGQCLISYFKTGRSGNRGMCAQICRHPFDLYKDDERIYVKDKFLLSPKDLCTIDKIPELIESGIDSFKIEGRMKSKEYVGLVTRVYRNKIDTLIHTDEDILNMKKLFNRDFTLGHLYNQTGKDLINGHKPNHLGVYIGKVIDYKKNEATIELSSDVKQGDAIRIVGKKEEGFYLNRLCINGLLVNSAKKGDIITVITKNKVEPLSNVYKTVDITLNNYINETSIDRRKVYIDGKFKTINSDIIFTITDGIHNEEITLKDVVFEAKNKPTTKEEIKEKLEKLGNEIFKFKNLDIDIDENIFISMSTINNLRRDIIYLLKQDRVKKGNKKYEEYSFKKLNISKENDVYFEVQNEEQLKYILDTTDYKCYVSDRFLLEKYKNNDRVLNQNKIVRKYKDILDNITDSNFNVVNSYSIYHLHSLGAKAVTLSYELDINKIKDIYNNFKCRYNFEPNLQVVIYGKPEVMTSKYCILNTYLGNGKKTNCSICKNGNYYLVDRDDKKYKIKKSNDCFMHILNYENVNLLEDIKELNKIGITNYRIILDDETSLEIKNIINTLKSSKVIL